MIYNSFTTYKGNIQKLDRNSLFCPYDQANDVFRRSPWQIERARGNKMMEQATEELEQRGEKEAETK